MKDTDICIIGWDVQVVENGSTRSARMPNDLKFTLTIFAYTNDGNYYIKVYISFSVFLTFELVYLGKGKDDAN